MSAALTALRMGRAAQTDPIPCGFDINQMGWKVIKRRKVWRSRDGQWEVAWDAVKLSYRTPREMITLTGPDGVRLLALTSFDDVAEREFKSATMVKELDCMVGIIPEGAGDEDEEDEGE